jgi:hypothetical protein
MRMLAIVLLALALAYPAPSLSDRNYYSDEVKVINPCLLEHGYVYPWSELCQGQGKLETDYGSTIMENITVYTEDSGRINGVLAWDGFRSIPSVKPKGYSDGAKYASRVFDTINTVNQYQCVAKKGNCLILEVKDVRFQTDNLIRGIHFDYPFIHVQENEAGWCFTQP